MSRERGVSPSHFVRLVASHGVLQMGNKPERWMRVARSPSTRGPCWPVDSGVVLGGAAGRVGAAGGPFTACLQGLRGFLWSDGLSSENSLIMGNVKLI